MSMEYIILTIAIIGFLGSIFILIRNHKVYKFRTYIADLIYSRGCDMIDDGVSYQDVSPLWDILNNISYEEMLFSLKPLKMECWFTDDELKLLGYERKNI